VLGEVEVVVRVTGGGPVVSSASVETTPADARPENNIATHTVAPVGTPARGLASPATPPTPKAKTGARRSLAAGLRSITVGRSGRQLLVGGVAGRAGTVEIVARRGPTTVATCRSHAPGGVSFACALRLAKGESPKGIVVSLRLRAGRTVVDRRVALIRSLGVSRDGTERWKTASLSS